jgi:hypothetical protein
MFVWIKKFIYSLLGKPFIDVRFSMDKDGKINVDAKFNQHYIYVMDRTYDDNPLFDKHWGDDDKVLFNLYDIVSTMADPLLPEEPIEERMNEDDADPFKDVPVLAFRGGQEVKQVVDIGKINPEDRQVIVRG